MTVSTVEFKKVCTIVSFALSEGKGKDVLEIKSNGDLLTLSTTDYSKEYYISAKFKLEQEEKFHATVVADTFLKLISQITTDTITFSITNNYLIIKGNGNYKIALIYSDENKLLELTPITIDNVTISTNISGDKLFSILNINSTELTKMMMVAKPVQNLYYLDEEGCITFTSGACVNNFKIDTPLKVLFNSKTVKLFKLFKNDEQVEFKLGYDSISDASGKNTTLLTKVSFETESTRLTVITPSNDVLLAQVPVQSIRSLANKLFSYSIMVQRDELIRAINRLLVFTNKTMLPFAKGKITLNSNELTIMDEKENIDSVEFTSSMEEYRDNQYSFQIPLLNLRDTLNTCAEDYVAMSFGDRRAIVIVCNNVKHIIPEVE